MSLNSTHSASRLHIAVLGACNSGKSSVVNLLAGQQVSIVSAQAGTTTDPVRKAMEVHGLGPVVLIDTAGFNDESLLGESRVEATNKALGGADIALLLVGEDAEAEREWEQRIRARGIPVVKIANKSDLCRSAEPGVLRVSALTNDGREVLLDAILRAVPASFDELDLLRGLVGPGDVVMLVMPQDSQAPKGRLILPQVQTIRALLDKGCIPVCTTPERMTQALEALAAPPSLIITDSQAFSAVAPIVLEGSRLTSFSVLMAGYKGDLDYFVPSAETIGQLRPGDAVLIAEACTHAPNSEDIGRVKIPALLNKKANGKLDITIVAGTDFPTDLTPYKLVIHCGGCMFNRRMVLSRVALAKEQGVPMTNYGIALAYLTGILPRIVY